MQSIATAPVIRSWTNDDGVEFTTRLLCPPLGHRSDSATSSSASSVVSPQPPGLTKEDERWFGCISPFELEPPAIPLPSQPIERVIACGLAYQQFDIRTYVPALDERCAAFVVGFKAAVTRPITHCPLLPRRLHTAGRLYACSGCTPMRFTSDRCACFEHIVKKHLDYLPIQCRFGRPAKRGPYRRKAKRSHSEPKRSVLFL